MNPIYSNIHYTRIIKKGDKNPYIKGSDNYNNWEAKCNSPDPNPNEMNEKCNRTTNAPCEWSKTHPLYDKCAMCGIEFPEWN